MDKNNEKNKILFHRVFWAIICLLVTVLPLILGSFLPSVKMVGKKGVVERYYDSLNETQYSMTIEFNRPITGGNVEVRFYDEYGAVLATETYKFTVTDEDNNVVESKGFITVKGKVASFEVIDYSNGPLNPYVWIYIFLLPAVIMFISALMLNYREVKCNGMVISCYAGFVHHTLRVNGELCDEHTTLIDYFAINLSATVENKEAESQSVQVEACISALNRITIKVNGKLVK